MTRRHFTFACEGSQLVATLDDADGTTGLLLLTGGNEVRAGAWAGQAQFAARIAAAGHPVLRFDRRGCGDSEGENHGFRSNGPDIVAALAALRSECPQVSRVVGMGNCDAASALMLAGGAGCDALILSNPWTFESEAAPQSGRNHYRNRLADPRSIKRLLTGKVALGKLARSLVSAARSASMPGTLAKTMTAGIAAFPGPIHILLADRDRTGQAFLAASVKADPRIERCPGATHGYAEAHAREWLADRVLEALRA